MSPQLSPGPFMEVPRSSEAKVLEDSEDHENRHTYHFHRYTEYLLAVGRQYALLCEIEEAMKYVKRGIKADSSLKAEFLDDPAFDPLWESF